MTPENVAVRTEARVVAAAVPFPVAGEDDIVAAVLDAATPRTRLAQLYNTRSEFEILAALLQEALA